MKEYYPVVKYPTKYEYQIVNGNPNLNLPSTPQKPIEPILPKFDKAKYRKDFFTALLIIAFVISLLNNFSINTRVIIFFSIIGIVALIFYLKIFPKKKQNHLDEMKSFKLRISNYEKELKAYNDKLIKHEQKIKNLTTPEAIKRFKKIERWNIQVIPPKFTKENNKINKCFKSKSIGITHDFFYQYLINAFGSHMISDAMYIHLGSNYLLNGRHNISKNIQLFEDHPQTIFNKYTRKIPAVNDYLMRNQFIYLPEFVYFDSEKKIIIDIEIDEPYQHQSGRPIYFQNDYKIETLNVNSEIENQLLDNANWIIVRFAEEQIIKYPQKCCNLIKEVINRYCEIKIIQTNNLGIPNIKLWTKDEAYELAFSRYRESYLPTELKNRFNNSFL